jgi:hypothetical protein
MHQKPNEILRVTNSGDFITTYDIPLNFSLIDFAPNCKIEWVAAVHETDSQSCNNMIIGQDYGHEHPFSESMTPMGWN